jgi:hypothetical protein
MTAIASNARRFAVQAANGSSRGYRFGLKMHAC